jgi:hypothetical protein
MTLDQLRAFIEAHRLGSFTAAAEALGVAQASMSELVRRHYAVREIFVPRAGVYGASGVGGA